MKILNKKEVIDTLASRGYTKKDAEIIIDDVFGMIIDCISRGDGVSIHGFGRFAVKDRAGRYTTNPTTHQPSYVKPHKAVQFTCGNLIKRALYTLEHSATEGDVLAESK